jgi:nitrile hydratase
MAINTEQALAATLVGASARVDVEIPPRFKVGDGILVLNLNPRGHTRLPHYLRGKRGIVERDYGVFAFPDAHAHGLGEKPQHVYSVKFSAKEVWGREGGERDFIVVDVWDDYMDPAA